MHSMLDGLSRIAWFLASLVIFGIAARLDIFPNALAAILAVALLNYLAILIHELGHAWAAKWRGAEVLEIAVLPFSYIPSQRRLRTVRWNTNGDIGGYVISEFPGYTATRKDDAIIAAAGPLANFMTAAVVALGLAMWQPSPQIDPQSPAIAERTMPSENRATAAEADHALPSREALDRIVAQHEALKRQESVHETASGLAILLAAISLVLGFANLIPTRGSDGHAILQALRRQTN